MKKRRQELWNLFLAFFRIGMFTFGGGFAMLPLIEREVIDRHGWADRDEILDIYALAQSVPGAIGVNTAIFIGKRLYGFWGAIAGLIGIVTPSVMIILIIAYFFTQIQSIELISRAFGGIRAAVVGLIAAAAVRIGKGAVKDTFGFCVALGACILSVSGFIHVIWVMILGGVSGYLYYGRKKERLDQ
ncbi:MAG: chromate transporter [Firmicutes bacterium]|jgi:chromate transporter|nr:chromate transporter [Bacillota bacterium]